ncbi:tyrosine-type recombinase/integrase [Oceanidesulfovibrio marinus]|uniref:Site-specific integrase n=1 Tax=Oceanidesulfovibrio marinus TaxID=370038 RepID=A0A6P1ZGA8_9BACT|nr:tyrosine-type recombinase/integrase [Oceanidesulfovibrio marinus]TVM31603.1 site-specific integrase [Oceanidesulfovibrio marinus]
MSVHQTKKTKKWYVKWWVPDEKKYYSKWFGAGPKNGPEHRNAMAFDLEIKAKKALNKELPRKPPVVEEIYLEGLAKAYANHQRASGKSSRWLKEWLGMLDRHILPLVGHSPVNALTYQDMMRVVDYYTDRGCSPHTINRYLSYLKAMFRFGIRHGITTGNPLEHWRKRKEPPKQCLLNLEDLRRIQAHSPPHLAWGIEVAFNLVVRVGASELMALTWDRVDWSKRGVWVFMSKTNREKFVPCTDQFLAKLKSRKETANSRFIVEYKNQPFLRFRGSWKNAVRKAGIQYHTTPYDIRHLAITELLARGVDPGAVADIAGHSSAFFTITRYHHVREGAKRSAIEALPALVN